jgi:hypothetical protein
MPGGDLSFHRFQMVLWTILMGVIFVASVHDNLAMPKFSGPLLALMGIRAATYVGFELLGNGSTSDGSEIRKECFDENHNSNGSAIHVEQSDKRA